MSNTVSDEVNVLDLFCGAGGFSAGLEMADDCYNVIGGIDFEEEAIETFEKNHNKAQGFVRDISETNAKKIEESLQSEVDMVIGGPPCKGFSSIRPNRSSDEIDYRNYLYQDYLRFVRHFQPDVFVMENVPEIINHEINDEKVLNMITSRIKEMGYQFEWKLLNSAYYGVPQARTRFILIGTKNSNTIPFPEPTHEFKDDSVEAERIRYQGNTITSAKNSELKPVVTVDEALSDLPSVKAGGKENYYDTSPNNNFQKLMREKQTQLSEHRATNHSESTMKFLPYAGHSRKDIPEEVRPETGYTSTYSRLYANEPATTITTEYVTAGASRSLHPHDDRALTVREGMRLQSFPDWYEFSGAKTSIVEQVGNAVPPLLGKAIGISIMELMIDRKHETVAKL